MSVALVLLAGCLSLAPDSIEVWSGDCQVKRKEGNRPIERKTHELQLRLEIDAKGNFTGVWTESRQNGDTASLNIKGVRTKKGLTFKVTSVAGGDWTDAVDNWSGEARIEGDTLTGRATGKSKRVTRENAFELKKTP